MSDRGRLVRPARAASDGSATALTQLPLPPLVCSHTLCSEELEKKLKISRIKLEETRTRLKGACYPSTVASF
jgi:hypothetical protein